MDAEDRVEPIDSNVVVDVRSFLTWLATAFVLYELLSGLVSKFFPFSSFTQYSIVVHTIVGVVSLVPVAMVVYLHWKRRRDDSFGGVGRVAVVTATMLILALLTGVIVTLQAVFGEKVEWLMRMAHLLTSLALAAMLAWHLSPVVARYRSNVATRRRQARRRFATVAIAVVATLFAMTAFFAWREPGQQSFQAFDNSYDWPYGDDHPFWPSRAAIANPPWENELLDIVSAMAGDEVSNELRLQLARPRDAGALEHVRSALATLDADVATRDTVDALATQLIDAQRQSGSIDPAAIGGSDSCGSSGCHEAIYHEWQSSAHGFAAKDSLFLQVQQLLIDSQGTAASRSCAGCHDPAALLGGMRFGPVQNTDELKIFEGVSCVVCHSTINTDTEGNGGYVVQVPERYLFAGSTGALGAAINRFLIRSYPEMHNQTYSRPLYKGSDFCAACHKQVPAPGDDTQAGLAQEQNEYDSWKSSRWYHEDDPVATIECRECHMPLVDSEDPASGDDTDLYRSPGDGKHRSHRVLASNMYIPMQMDLPGAEEQAALTIAWLQGEIDVPEIADRWATGPVVKLDIEAPDKIRPGELVNIKLHLRNHKTGHDFPAGPLDVLESWVELTVTDEAGNVLMRLGADHEVGPSIDTPVVYKADWYDRQGLPVEQHNLWDVVGASYKRVIQSGGADVIDVPFRCPGIARPRLSESASESGPGERRSDVAFKLERAEITELTVTARLLFRKANPQFLAKVYDLPDVALAPVIELVSATQVIRVADD